MKPPSEEVQKLLLEVVEHFDTEDSEVRERQIRTWRQLKLFWESFQKTWYSEVAHDVRIWENDVEGDDDQDYYDKPVNIYRAYLESIIAALSVTVPPIKCYPDDAENTLDLQTAKAGDKIAQLLFRHNDAPLLWLHALFIFCTEGMMACYSYPKSDKSYGETDKKEYKDENEEHQYSRCPNCGYNLEDEEVQALSVKLESNRDKFQPGPEDVPIQESLLDTETEFCPACEQQIVPMLVQETLVVTRLVGVTKEAKTRICMEIYGGLYVKVPNYAKTQADCPYLIYSYETHFANALEKYEHIDGDKLRGKIRGAQGRRDPYNEEVSRLSPQYNGDVPVNVVTIRNAWLRPSAFNILDDEDARHLRKLYPNGVRVALVNDDFAEAENESLDDCWTLTQNPMSDYLHFDPLGMLLICVQELVNDLISLIQQTIEHGIGQTFADPEVLNFNAYRQMESIPGGVYEAKPKSGRSLNESFFEVKTATLSSEVLPFLQQLQSLGQMVSGALPSLFGGAIAGGGTASEYSMSRAQALQRLQNNWKMLIHWWKNIFGKAIPMFIKEVQEDIRDVQKTKDGNFINVFIRKAELEGRIGKVELEANENLPITWNNKKDILMQLLETGNPEILAMLGSPSNLPIIREAIGLDDFNVPGEDDRDKQFDEIKELLNTEPMMDPESMMEMPSVEVNFEYDNHEIEFAIVRKWVISEAGRQAKIDNPAGYKNVLLHGQMHIMALSGEMASAQEPGAVPAEQAPEDTEAPIAGEENVSTV